MRLAFIGYGNMSSALIGGILSSKKFNPSDEIYIFHNKKIVISISKNVNF